MHRDQGSVDLMENSVHFQCKNSEGSHLSLNLTIPISEIMGVSANLTAGKIWPASILLAHFLLHHAPFLANGSIFEFGSGMAMPSLCAVKAGIVEKVYLQELDIPALLQMQRIIFSSNQISLDRLCQLPFTWGQPPPTLPATANLSLIIAADCLYERNDFRELVRSLRILMEKYPGVPFVMCYQDRNLLYCLDEIFEEFGMKSGIIELSTFWHDEEGTYGEGMRRWAEEFPSKDDIYQILVMLEVQLTEHSFIFSRTV